MNAAPLQITELPNGNIVVEVFHGGDKCDEPKWFTNDEAHAAYFGDVTKYRIELSSWLRVDARTDSRLQGQGEDGDSEAYRLLEETAVGGLIIDGWEHGSTSILLADWSDSAIVAIEALE